jgi:ferredoxin
VRILVDRERCAGHGMCEITAPEVYLVDDDGQVEILQDPLPADLEADARSGAAMCPVKALSLL